MTAPPPVATAGNGATQIVDAAEPRWRLGAAQIAGAAAAIVLAGTGLVLARLDLALLALPLIAGCAWAWDRRPDRDRPTTLTAEVTDRPGQAELACTFTLAADDRVDAVGLRLTRLGGRPQEIVLVPSALTAFTVRAPLLHSGPQELFHVEYRLFAADGSLATAPLGPLRVVRVISPVHTAITSLPLPRRLQGVTGTHESARPGDGGDFRDIHPFTAGDRLRRIDWKVTARRARFAGDLYVRRTAATADATVFLVIDSRDDVGEQVSEWSNNSPTRKGTSSLDVAREAASAIAAGYIRAGDRVGFQDLASSSRMLAPGGGSRHLLRLLRRIELTTPTNAGQIRRLRPPVVTTGALIYVLSSFLDGEAGRMAALWTGSGHRVIAVDVLPPALLGQTNRYDRTAHRMLMMARDDRVRALGAYGVEIVHWPDDGATVPRAARLRVLSRPGRGGR